MGTSRANNIHVSTLTGGSGMELAHYEPAAGRLPSIPTFAGRGYWFAHLQDPEVNRSSTEKLSEHTYDPSRTTMVSGNLFSAFNRSTHKGFKQKMSRLNMSVLLNSSQMCASTPKVWFGFSRQHLRMLPNDITLDLKGQGVIGVTTSHSFFVFGTQIGGQTALFKAILWTYDTPDILFNDFTYVLKEIQYLEGRPVKAEQWETRSSSFSQSNPNFGIEESIPHYGSHDNIRFCLTDVGP
ncbi:general transcription repressor [Ascosphaera pollenicola]|nr:general transcription repressor [Ascosphaera pollenicola]